MITIANGWIPSVGMLPEMRRVWPTDMEVQDESNVNKIKAGLLKRLPATKRPLHAEFLTYPKVFMCSTFKAATSGLLRKWK